MSKGTAVRVGLGGGVGVTMVPAFGKRVPVAVQSRVALRLLRLILLLLSVLFCGG